MSSTYQIILKRRTIRRFKQRRIPYRLLRKIVNAARLAPSAANLQPLEYLIIDTPSGAESVFPFLKWASYISPKGIPPLDKRPTAYIAVLVNRNKQMPDYSPYDIGAAVENLILSGWEEGLGACWIKAMDREKLESLLNLPKYLELDSMLALGYRGQIPKPVEFKASPKYWLDSRGRLNVPKRSLESVLHHNKIVKHG